VALQELRPFIEHGQHLLIGRPFASFHEARSRELLANWLLCVVANFDEMEDRFNFASDPDGGDGFLVDKRTGRIRSTEHVIALSRDITRNVTPESVVLAAIQKKIRKGGAAYASGKDLVVFAEGLKEEWYVDRVARSLPHPYHFSTIWVVTLQSVSKGSYSYGVSELDLSAGHCPMWIVTIGKKFDRWSVQQIQ
jgi:hypothetical protein